MSAPNGERRLRRWAAALIAVLGLLVVGTWSTVGITTNYLLEREAAAGARNWAEFLAANIGDLEQIAAGEQPVAASMAFFEIARKSGQVFRYVIFNRDGYSQLVSDRERIALVDLSEFSLQAASAMTSGSPQVDFRKADMPALPAYYAAAYVPVRAGDRPVAVVAAYVDQTEQRRLFFQTFVAAAAALCTLTALSFGVPAIAWYRRTKEKQRAERSIRFLAHHDPLTGLINRASFVARLEHALVQGRAQAGEIALHVIDIDRFKDVNDTLGHDGGDVLLKAVAERLRRWPGKATWWRGSAATSSSSRSSASPTRRRRRISRAGCGPRCPRRCRSATRRSPPRSASASRSRRCTARRRPACSRAPISRSTAPRRAGAIASASSRPSSTRPCRRGCGWSGSCARRPSTRRSGWSISRSSS